MVERLAGRFAHKQILMSSLNLTRKKLWPSSGTVTPSNCQKASMFFCLLSRDVIQKDLLSTFIFRGRICEKPSFSNAKQRLGFAAN